MFTPDESLEQVRSAGRAATSARANAELLTSPNVAMISVTAYQVRIFSAFPRQLYLDPVILGNKSTNDEIWYLTGYDSTLR